MNIINRKTIIYYTEKYPKAKNQLLTWYNEILKQEFENFNQLKAAYGNASIVNAQRFVFNIKGNEYRLIVSIISGEGRVILFGLEHTMSMIK